MSHATDTPAGSLASSTCLRKKAYETDHKAWSCIFSLRARGQDTERLAPYRCEHCRKWHLGRGLPAARNPT
jgi:hypothetical protein